MRHQGVIAYKKRIDAERRKEAGDLASRVQEWRLTRRVPLYHRALSGTAARFADASGATVFFASDSGGPEAISPG